MSHRILEAKPIMRRGQNRNCPNILGLPIQIQGGHHFRKFHENEITAVKLNVSKDNLQNDCLIHPIISSLPSPRSPHSEFLFAKHASDFHFAINTHLQIAIVDCLFRFNTFQNCP